MARLAVHWIRASLDFYGQHFACGVGIVLVCFLIDRIFFGEFGLWLVKSFHQNIQNYNTRWPH